MVFTLLPSVDVADGRTVRIVRGQIVTGRSDEPAEVTSPLDAALAYQADGAGWVHLVDVDAAFARGSNTELLESVIGILDIDVQLSGGVRDATSLTQALSTGCTRVVIATSALVDPSWCAHAIAEHGDRVAIGLDVRLTERPDGPVRHRLAARGEDLDRGDLWETLALLDRAGCARYVVADAGRDGALTGPDIELFDAITEATDVPVVASGGVSSIEDLVALARSTGVEGSVIGSALVTGRFTLTEAISALRDVARPGAASA